MLRAKRRDDEPLPEASTMGSSELDLAAAGYIYFNTKVNPLKKHLQRFQLDRARFSNASLEEKLEHVRSLEQRAEEAIASESWDALCNIIREATAALAAPKLHSVFAAEGSEKATDCDQQAGLQHTLRKIVTQGLQYLDFCADEGTASLLEPALSYIRMLLQKSEGQHAAFDPNEGYCKQWRDLHALVRLQEQQRNDVQASPRSMKQEDGRSGNNPNRKHRSTRGGMYIPSPRIQALAIVRDSGEAVVLTCKNCGHKLTSSWVVEIKGQTRILTPGNGHVKCGGRYKVPDGKRCQVDIPANIDFCSHGRQRHTCIPCGGSHVCPHSLQRNHCRICSLGTVIKHRNRQKERRMQKRLQDLAVPRASSTSDCQPIES
eukprot:TRINITY_DN66860_c0_g1_i1.p1 TRINITY_DN66860_c0_g1~~TRINITY_DN66860_c0_g1_i1.p1  ORF type:complete len:375 (-),score=64.63 TRINITY_DN66860_c0_g1_i1:360-1484(-)